MAPTHRTPPKRPIGVAMLQTTIEREALSDKILWEGAEGDDCVPMDS